MKLAEVDCCITVYCVCAALCSVGSPLWADVSCQDLPSDDVDSLCQFLLTLCYLLRNSYASCIITVPTHLFQVMFNLYQAWLSLYKWHFSFFRLLNY
jgi:hypothetical protein